MNIDLANLKCNVDKLDIDKLKNVPSELRNLKSKVHKLDVDKLVPVPVDLSKLSDVVKNGVVKKDVYNAQIKNIENKIPNINNLATTAALTAIENKIPNVSNVKKTDYNIKTSEIKNKINTYYDHDKCITTQKFNKLISENFTARLKQACLASKSNIAIFVKRQIFIINLKKMKLLQMKIN